MLRNLGNLKEKKNSPYLTSSLNDIDTNGDNYSRGWCSIIVDALKINKFILSVSTYCFAFEYEELRCNILFLYV